ncbi:acylphosphatase [Pelagibacterium xiamenense]|uniref:acylphosphatase n=1 Tax=Pelagibacterium xiamenense TaxID=2901140 RepID=UPI001E399ADB|nr:acylphosphatase [Pelagibacterium xiamenense]MCD7060544.1 acylphosphatase [Pelagibacterium xiamenense]
MTTIAVRARITGHVQGVAFRAWTRVEAERHGLSGWVRNQTDGSVEALVIGPSAEVAAMVRALHKGPPAARISTVDTEKIEPDTEVRDFRILG